MPGGGCTGGGGFSRIDVADDDDVDVSLFFTVIEKYSQSDVMKGRHSDGIRRQEMLTPFWQGFDLNRIKW